MISREVMEKGNGNRIIRNLQDKLTHDIVTTFVPRSFRMQEGQEPVYVQEYIKRCGDDGVIYPQKVIQKFSKGANHLLML